VIGQDIRPLNLGGRLECQLAVRWAMVSMKFAQNCSGTALRASSFMWIAGKEWSCFMASSRKPERRQPPIWTWLVRIKPQNMRRHWNDKKRSPFRSPTGSSFDSFLEEEGILEEAQAVAIKRVIAWQLAEAMKAGKISKKEMAERMGTSRSQLDRLLDPETVQSICRTITRAARAVGKRLRLEMVGRSLIHSLHRSKLSLIER